MKKARLYYFFLFLLILAFIFRDLLLNISTNLIDWRDYPYIIWVIYQSIDHIKTLDFVHFFDTNAFYPHKNTLLFSDLLLPQSVIGLPFSYLTDNPILVFNIIFFVTMILNYLSSFLFWNNLFKKHSIAFLGSLLTVFSPILHGELSHFQMQSYWPFFISLYFLYKSKQNHQQKYPLLSGLFLTIQFLASVYISVFLMLAMTIYFSIEMLTNKKVRTNLRQVFIIFGVFLLSSGIFIKGYLDAKKIYNIKRDYGEYVSYAAHLSDYMFTNSYHSIIHNSKFVSKWNSFNKHPRGAAMFPGFLLVISAFYNLIKARSKKNQFQISIQFNKESLLFVLLLIVGFTFSLGPRLNFNGKFVEIPLPYHIIVKYLPFVDQVRATVRWSFLFYFGVLYLSLFTINKYVSKRIFIYLIFLIFLIEYIPTSFKTSSEMYLTQSDYTLASLCQNQKKVLLEVPITHFDGAGGIAQGLSNVTKMELASLYHQCYLVNGYSGYDLPELATLKDNFYNYLDQRNANKLISLVKDNQADILKINRNKMDDYSRSNYEALYSEIKNNSNIKEFETDLFLINR